MFRYSDLVGYRIREAKAHAPANYVYHSIHPCYGGGAGATSPRLLTSAVQHGPISLELDLRGRPHAGEPDSREGYHNGVKHTAQYPGTSIDKIQGISFQLTGSSKLPTDPTHITFKIYDTVLVGTSGVQTTGTPLVLP